MQWIKRNLLFVSCGAIALVLLGVAGWFLYSNIQRDNEIQEGSDGLQQQLSEAQRLSSLPASVTQENIEEAKKQQKALKDFRGQLRDLFAPAPVFDKMDDRAFSSYLLKALRDLSTAASNANVILPDKFKFTFTAQTVQSQFPAESIDLWTKQLADIKSICDALYQSKINALDAIQRVPVAAMDNSPGEFLTATIMTNQAGTTFSPYFISFRSFSGDLAAVLERFSRSTNCIIVKSINVTPSTVPLPAPTVSAPGAPTRFYYPATARPAPRPTVAEVDRYGLGGKGGGAPPPQPTAIVARSPQTAASTVTTVLAERPLQVTMLLEIVRLGESK